MYVTEYKSLNIFPLPNFLFVQIFQKFFQSQDADILITKVILIILKLLDVQWQSITQIFTEQWQNVRLWHINIGCI